MEIWSEQGIGRFRCDIIPMSVSLFLLDAIVNSFGFLMFVNLIM